MTYIGETKRTIRLRFNEDVLSARNKTPDTPIGDHLISAHLDYKVQRREIPLSVYLLQKTVDHAQSEICESLLIRKHRPQLDRHVCPGTSCDSLCDSVCVMCEGVDPYV